MNIGNSRQTVVVDNTPLYIKYSVFNSQAKIESKNSNRLPIIGTIYEVTSTKANLYSSKNTKKKVLLTLYQGDQIVVMSTSKAWAKAKYSQMTGYIKSANIKKVGR